MIVMKFGGTSVGAADRIRTVVKLVKDRLDRKPIVVTSALSKVTDQLLAGANLALQRESPSDEILKDLRIRHESVIAALLPEGPKRKRLLDEAARIFDELDTLYTGVYFLEELTPRSRDAIAAMGERLAGEILATALNENGVRACALDSRGILITDETFGRATPDMAETANRVRRSILPIVDAGEVPVLGGFIGGTSKGVTTTLGRGGSDWSASIFGACVNAEEIQIWTDVDGMMTVDPRIVSTARVIPAISVDEAAELAYFGAKVLHPATIKPALEKNIPVRILNTLNPQAPGTVVLERTEAGPGPCAIAAKRNITIVQVSQPRMLMASGFLAHVFQVFDRHRTPVDMIATSEVSVAVTIDTLELLPQIQSDLAQLGEVRVLKEMSIVSLVGKGFFYQAGLAGRMFQCLRDVNIVMISFGASDVNISFVTADADAERAVLTLHKEFFES